MLGRIDIIASSDGNSLEPTMILEKALTNLRMMYNKFMQNRALSYKVCDPGLAKSSEAPGYYREKLVLGGVECKYFPAVSSSNPYEGEAQQNRGTQNWISKPI